ncbi:hypothetical protein ACFYWU_36025 [Streptomyces chrestomyceticus]|uniref:hypothetical protein n=1 Tax=Streptomyces chrestomyceticus TaxID=68185 RepID=UPI0036985A86
MDAGLAAILGAAVGACGTAVAAGVAGFLSRSQTKLQLAAQDRQLSRQIRADLVTQLREPRRQAYAAFAAETSAKLEALWWVAEALAGDPPQCEAAERLLRENFVPSADAAYERVLMEGPEEVASAAAHLAAGVESAGNIAFTWLARDDDSRESDLGNVLAELRVAREAAVRLRRIFRMITMDTIRADGAEPESEQAQARTSVILGLLQQHRDRDARD